MFTSAVAVTIVPANPGLYFVPVPPGSTDPAQGIVYHGSSNASCIVSVDGGITGGSAASVTVNGREYTYTATALDTLDTIRDALVVQLNTDPQVSAGVAGVFDRIILKARVAGPEGSGIPVTGSATGGSLTVTVLDGTTCCANVAGTRVTATNPALPGEIIIMYGTGLGLPVLTDQVQSLVQTGVPYPLNGPPTLPQPANFVSGSAGGSTIDVLQATMLPGSVGGYQIVAHLNSSLVTNSNTMIDIAQGTFISNQVAFPLVSQTGVSGFDPAFLISSSQNGDFYQGEQNAAYTLSIANTGGGNPTTGLVTVTETVPAGLTLVQMIGDGWNCSANVCTRSDALLRTLSYPVITVIVNVTSSAASSVTNSARITGGGAASAIANDVTIVNATATSTPSKLSIASTHSGNFTLGQQNAAYTLTVSNASNAGATSGAVNVNEVLPTGLELVSLAGTGWTCNGFSCTRSDVLSSGSKYPTITVTVNVDTNAPSSVTNTVVVSGGGSGAAIGTDGTTIH
jgi:uncharacterized repeat protein (TIGR01451 family)